MSKEVGFHIASSDLAMASAMVDAAAGFPDALKPFSSADSELPASHVVLQVTPDLQPTRDLQTVPLADILREIAGGALVDPGGQMAAAADATALEPIHPHGFVSAAVAAFANHFPMQLRPQHIHLLILQGIAFHVDSQPESLRSKWVKHADKMTLVVQRDHFVLGSANDWSTA